jgi:hypothetical protein
MSKSVVAIMIPTMGGGMRTTTTKARRIVTTTLATRATRQGRQQQIQPVIMSKYVVATMIPMMGELEENFNQGKSYHEHGASNTND